MNIEHFPRPQLDEMDNTDITIDFEQPTIHEPNQTPAQEIHDEFRSTRDVITNAHVNRRPRRGRFCICAKICLRRSFICASRLIKFMCTRKIYFFIFFLMTSIFLRLSQVFSEKFIFWVAYFPMIIILIAGIFKLCIIAQRAREEFENTAAQRRTIFNERLLRQIVMHDIQNRLQIAVAMDPRRTGFHNVHASMQAIQNQRAIIRQILFELGALEENGFFAQRQNAAQQQGLSQEQIDGLPLEPYAVKGEQETCSICIDEFEQGSRVRKLPCLHQFHPNCIDDWLKIQNTCPNCKAEIPIRGGGDNNLNRPRNLIRPVNLVNPIQLLDFNLRDEEGI